MAELFDRAKIEAGVEDIYAMDLRLSQNLFSRAAWGWLRENWDTALLELRVWRFIRVQITGKQLAGIFRRLFGPDPCSSLP